MSKEEKVAPDGTVEQDELDSWFDGTEDEGEDQSVDEFDDEEEQPSGPDSEDEDIPDNKTPAKDAKESASDTGTSDKPAQEDPYAWVEKLDPEIRKHAEALVHRDRSNSGRVAALSSRLDKLTAQQKAALESDSQRRSRPASEPVIDEEDVDESLASFMKEYPTVAESVEKMVARRVAQEREDLLKEVRPLQQARVADENFRERQELRARAAEIFNSAETDIYLDDVLQSTAWKEWLEAQPEGYRQFVGNANRADDAAKVLQDFATYAERKAYMEYEAQQASAQDSKKPGASNADQVAARRKQVRESTTPDSKSGSLSDTNAGSYDEWFDYFVENG